MRKRHLVDTNLIVRHLVQDDEQHSKAAARLFEASDHGELTIVLLPAVLAESVFVLQSFYKQRREDIASALATLVTGPGVEMDEAAIHLDALERYRKSTVHFVDCLIAATGSAKNLPVASFDRDFRKFTDVRIELR